MFDDTEAARRKRLAEINAESCERAALEARYGQVWDTRELARNFIVIGFMSPYVVVQRKDTGEKGSLEFQPSPRYYHSFKKA